MSYRCSFRNRTGKVCKVESYSPRCTKHLGKQTHILCINCDTRFTSSYLSICSAEHCLNIRDAYRAQHNRKQQYFNAEFAAECVERLKNNAADMAP
jgi:hypothetical protein